MPRLLYGPWEPDKPPFLSKGLQVVSNVYAGPLGYRPIGQLTALTAALPTKPLGAGSFIAPQGTASIIAGTATNLYRSLPMGWSSIGSGYSMTGEARWRFAQFGGLAVATNGIDAMAKVDLTTFAVAPLGGFPPRVKLLAVVKDFLVGGVIDGRVDMLEWSAINNAEGWEVGLDQCDYQIFPDGGEINGIFGGEVGLILQRGAIRRMTYVGDNLVFQFDVISANVGCVSRHTVAQAGQLGFFLSDTGFMMWDGGTLKPIGQERVDRTFSASYGRGDWPAMSTAIDVKNSLVAWSTGDKLYIYNWVLDRWSIVEQACPIVFAGFTRDLTLDEYAAMFPNIDTAALSMDDAHLKGGNPLFYAFGADNKMGSFSGSAMKAIFETGDLEFAQGRDARVPTIRPICDAVSGVTMTVGARSRLGDPLPANAYTSMMANGEMPVRECGQFIRLKQEIAAGTAWSYAQGVDVTVAAGARR